MSHSETSPPPQSLIEWAILYVRHGWPVFPLRARGKTPLTVRGFKDASTDEATVRAWWTRWPDANIGIPTGLASGLAVLDVDQPGGEASLGPYLEKFGALPDTPEQITGGGGRQVFFRFEEGFRNSAGHFGSDIDTRGEGGYIVAPPSVHPITGRAYEWEASGIPGEVELAPLPDWLKPGRPPLTRAPLLDGSTIDGNLGGTFDAGAVQMKATGAPVKPGGRNMAAASLAGQYLSAGDSMQAALAKLQAWNKSNPVPLADAEVERVVASVAVTHQRKNPGAVIPIAEVPADPETPMVLRPPKAFPAHLLSPPGFVGEVVQWILRTAYKPQPVLALANAIAFFGAVVGRKVQTPSRLRTNLYCLGVGESGCGKDHSRKAVKAICAAAGLADSLLGGEDISSDSAILGAVHEHPSILFQFDEIGHMIASNNSRYAQSHQRAIAPLLTKLFSSANTIYLGKEYAGRKDKRKDIEQPNVCIYGTTVPGRLYEGLTPAEISDGFLGRMLVFQSDAADPDPQEVMWEDPPASIVTMVETWATRRDLGESGAGNIAALTQHVPLMVPYEAEAKRRLKAFEQKCRGLKERARSENGLDVLWSRANEHAAKVALVLACGCEYSNPTVSGDVMGWSIDLVEYLTSALIETVGDSVAGSDFERDLLYVLRVVTNSGGNGIPHTDLARKTRRLTPRARTDILSELIGSGALIRRERKPQRGSSTYIYINPKLVHENKCALDESGNAA